MPSSMIFASLVVLWLLILVPAVAQHRQEVARPSVAALSGRVLARSPRRRSQEVDGMSERDGTDAVADGRAVATRELRVPAARNELRLDAKGPDRQTPEGVDVDRHDRDDAAEPTAADGGYRDDAGDSATGDGYRDGLDDPEHDLDDEAALDERLWEQPPPRYRAGRGGFDAEAAALTARARYAFRQRVVLVMLLAAVATAVVAAVAVRTVWWAHAAVDLALVGYLVYLRRQVRMEETIRARRAARMAGTRRPSDADDPELDEWAEHGRDAADGVESEEWDEQDDEADQVTDLSGAPAAVAGSSGASTPAASPTAGASSGTATGSSSWTATASAAGTTAASVNAKTDAFSWTTGRSDTPSTAAGTSAAAPATSSWPSVPADPPQPAEERPALPRLRQTPLPPLPAGTTLVDDEDDALDLDDGTAPGYRRAVGQ